MTQAQALLLRALLRLRPRVLALEPVRDIVEPVLDIFEPVLLRDALLPRLLGLALTADLDLIERFRPRRGGLFESNQNAKSA